MANNDHGAPAMDYAEHDRTYRGFMLFVEVGIMATLCIVVILALWGLKKAGGVAAVGLLATFAATAVGAFAPKLAWRPGAAVLVVLLALLAVL